MNIEKTKFSFEQEDDCCTWTESGALTLFHVTIMLQKTMGIKGPEHKCIYGFLVKSF